MPIQDSRDDEANLIIGCFRNLDTSLGDVARLVRHNLEAECIGADDDKTVRFWVNNPHRRRGLDDVASPLLADIEERGRQVRSAP